MTRARASVEYTTIVDGGRVFCAATYVSFPYFRCSQGVAKLDRLDAEMMYPELEKVAKIMVGLVREDFRLFTVSELETRSRFNNALATPLSENEEDAVCEQEATYEYHAVPLQQSRRSIPNLR
jgi:hypothetical protein